MDEVTSLRQDRGLTVRSIAHTTASRRCKTYKSQLCSRVPFIGQENPSEVPPSSEQLPRFLIDAGAAINNQLCFSNCQSSGLATNPLIRSRLLSPCLRSDRALSSRVRRRRPLHVMNLPILLLAVLVALLPIAAATNTKSKVPLVRTSDATTHVFRGAVTTVPNSSGLLRSVRRQTRGLEPLDFQTMKVVKGWGDKYTNALLVSGRNFMYVFNASQPWIKKPSLMHMKLLQWNSTASTRSRCTFMNNGDYECNNFIRIVEVLDGQLYVCGTNAYQPTCRYYLMSQLSRSSTPTDTEFVSEKTCGNTCGCPFNPLSTSAHLYANTSSGPRMFSAALIDYLGKKPLLMRSGERHLQTVEEWLNEPTFVKLIEYGDKIYLFFVETASEVETGTGSPMKYARVAQVCKDDIGGSTVLRHKWSTFLKARLQCSIPGTQVTEGLTLNNLTSVSDVTQVVGSDGTRMDVIFATFTTPWAWDALSMSAVCMFSMSESIQGLFNTGNFLGETQLQAKPGSSMYGTGYSIPTETVKAVPVADSVVPRPRPGSCQNADVPDDVSSFTKNHPLMFDPVQPLYRRPIFTTESDVRLTQIAVDRDAGYQNELMMYLGTEDGRILRVRPRLADNGDDIKSVLLEETSLEDKAKCDDGSVQCGVQSMYLARPPAAASRMSSIYRPTAYIAFTDRIRQIIITTCKSYGKADCCNADPECGWKGDACVLRTPRNNANLPPVNDLSTIPTCCQVEVPPPVDSYNQQLATGDSGSAVIIIIAVLLFFLGLILGAVFMHCRQKHRGSHNVSRKGNYRAESDCQEVAKLTGQSQQSNSQMDYMVIGRNSSSRASPTERPTTLSHDVEATGPSSYAPLTPSSIEENDFPGPEAPTQNDLEQSETDDGETRASPLHGQTLESEMFGELANRFQKAEEAILQHSDVGYNYRKLSTKEDPHSSSPPPQLPPKQKSFRQSPPDYPPPLLHDEISISDENTSNNNNRDLDTPTPPPPPPPPPPPELLLRSSSGDNYPLPPKEKAPEVIPPVAVISPRTPPAKPAPPRSQGIRKHQTFSAPHGNKVKPPVPPKSRTAVMRSASLRASPNARIDLGASPLTSTLPKMDSNVPRRIVTPRQRPPSFRHNSNVGRTPPKTPIPVLPPTVPGPN